MARIERQKEIISITHFINPHLFWYHKVDACSEDYHTILKIEKELGEYYNNRQGGTQAIRRPQINELVAVKFLSWNKLIRARVDHIASFGKNVLEGEFIMWALDYGFPFQTRADHIFRLPHKLTKPVDYIRCGGLANIVPAEEFFMKNTMVKKISNKWHQRANDIIEKAINDSEFIVFIKEFDLNQQDWGELVIKTNMGVKYRVKDHLISLHLATETVANFRDECQKLKTTKIAPWMCNNGNSKFYTNRAYIFPGVVGITHNASKCPELPFDIKAKKKVDDWYERNLATGQDTKFLDTTNEYTTTEETLLDSVSIPKDDQHEQELPEMEEDEESQQMKLGGILSKSIAERYSNGQSSTPRRPHDGDFELSAENTKANKTIETIESEISSISQKEKLSESAVEPHTIFAKQNEVEEHSKTDAIFNNVGTFVNDLITFRKQYNEKKLEEKTLRAAEANNFPPKDFDLKEVDNSKIATTKPKVKSKQEVTSLNSTFHGLRMVPAGYDLMNLCDYNDKEHWHCKKSTLNERVPY
ncbi:putative ATP-dependent RNA helicase SoYb isoform X2 [Zeugodacus cucurbitae]|uniref:putative ATP-dependent RNA helicase SoYb isoform X2 n=1 Tax=Zeugodacus cucurbitae TaxID=28588 RepID=UPI0023D9058A|nr:putative ATP-dependent RNA helicase SoYb isoform X2 [Zeugodacus cucurbitae]